MFLKKGVGTRWLKSLAASPLVMAPPSNLTRLYYNRSAAKSRSTTTQYRQLRGLQQMSDHLMTGYFIHLMETDFMLLT